MSRGLRRLVGAASTASCIGGTAVSLHALTLLLAAVSGRKRQPPPASDALGVAVLIPAHEEEESIAHAIDSVRAARYAVERLRVVVIADNCSDRTAAVARAAGAEVWERRDERRGKGHVLAWAIPRLLEDPTVDAICVVDADCTVSANLLGALAARLESGSELAQATYLIDRPEDSSTAALRWAGFSLFNFVRPLGRSRLGWSCGLFGTGMMFSRALAERSPWSAFSFAEDRDQHLRWVLAGARASFVPEAEVRTPAAVGSGTGTQEARWESGRFTLVRELSPQLLARWRRVRDPGLIDAAIEPALPPQSLVLANAGLALALSAVGASRRRRCWAGALVAAQVGYVVGGLLLVGAPRAVWMALLRVPQFVIRRFVVFARMSGGRGPTEWQRTPRT